MKSLVIVAIILVLVVFLIGYFFTHKSTTLFSFSAPTSSSAPSASPSLSSSPLQTKIVQLKIQNSKIVEGPKTIEVAKNQMIVLKITADADDELSLLGYNKHVFLEKDKTVILSFLSTITGNFFYQLEKTKNALGSIVVDNN